MVFRRNEGARLRQAAATLGVLVLAAAPRIDAGSFQPALRNGVPGEYVVVLKAEAAKLRLQRALGRPGVVEVAAALSRRFGGRVTEVWQDALPGFVIRTSPARARALAKDPRVASVEQVWEEEPHEVLSSAVGDCYEPPSNHRWNTRPLPLPSASASPQDLVCDDPDPSRDFGGSGQQPRCRDNWGLDRIDQRSGALDGRYAFDRTGRNPGVTNVVVFMVDTGIYAAHQEFRNAAGQSRVLGGFDATFCTGPGCEPVPSVEDCGSGHGTHVAGIIGGRTYGVAKDVFLVAVRFACPLRSHQPLQAISAFNWIASTSARPAVVNWSGGNTKAMAVSQGLVAAVRGVLDRGYLVVQSAGNQSAIFDYTSPATPGLVQDACLWSLGGSSAAGALVVGGSDENDERWTRVGPDPLYDYYWSTGDRGSNYGSCVDLWAPAAHIVSASSWGPQAYCRLSGTSMAAPHVTGAAALYLQAHPLATPAEVAQALVDGATRGALATTGLNRIGLGSPDRLLFSRVP